MLRRRWFNYVRIMANLAHATVFYMMDINLAVLHKIRGKAAEEAVF